MEKRKLNAWVTKEQLDFIKLTAENDKKNISMIIRDYIDFNMSKMAIETSLDRVCNILDKQINISLNKYLERIIGLVVKSAISSESSNINSEEILASIRKQDIEEIRLITRKKAISHMRRGEKIE